MKQPQVINLNTDNKLVFDGENVISNTTQLPLTTPSPIVVDIAFYDLSDGSTHTAASINMTYISSGWWHADIADIVAAAAGALVDRHKYVATVSEHAGGIADMRSFKVWEFTVDNDGFEDTWMRLPYEVDISGGEAWIYWYDTIGHFGNPLYRQYKAQAYQDGTETTWATRADRVTHRGPIVVY
jgi:hypothetical protein